MYSLIEKEELKNKILDKIREGQSLIKICKNKNLPNRDTINTWLNKDKDFSDKYVCAKELGFIKESYNLLEIVDNVALTREAIMKAKLQYEARQWLLSKLIPKKFGNAAQQTNIQINNITPVTGMQIVDETIEVEVKDVDGVE